jgi:hypothetical protein
MREKIDSATNKRTALWAGFVFGLTAPFLIVAPDAKPRKSYSQSKLTGGDTVARAWAATGANLRVALRQHESQRTRRSG